MNRPEQTDVARWVVDYEPGLYGPFETRAAAQEWAEAFADAADPAVLTSWHISPVYVAYDVAIPTERTAL